jgi:hypothetical protein
VAPPAPDLKTLPFPMLADIKRELSTAFGILDRKEGVALRGRSSSTPRRDPVRVGCDLRRPGATSRSAAGRSALRRTSSARATEKGDEFLKTIVDGARGGTAYPPTQQQEEPGMSIQRFATASPVRQDLKLSLGYARGETVLDECEETGTFVAPRSPPANRR